jgi:hypothetical protein
MLGETADGPLVAFYQQLGAGTLPGKQRHRLPP